MTDRHDVAPVIDGLLRGVRQIARAVNLPKKTTYALLQAGDLPGVKVRGLWVSTVPALREWAAKLTARCQDRMSGQGGDR